MTRHDVTFEKRGQFSSLTLNDHYDLSQYKNTIVKIVFFSERAKIFHLF